MYHLKLVWRQILRQKSYLVINTIGLAIALTASILIYTYLMKEWLQDFAYKINVDGWITVSVVCLSLLYIILITSWQVRRAARKNPIDAIKTE